MARTARNKPVPRNQMLPKHVIMKQELNSVLILSAALYIRLSKTNGGKNSPNTIENQLAVLEEYIANNSYIHVYNVYIDNGYSGTNFERPAFRQMMDDIKAGKVNCILVKDLSRFGRSYYEIGNYMEKIFPFLGVRFISVTDCFDTQQDKLSDTDITIALKNIANELYARDISRKVSSALDIKKGEGKYGGGVAPYGYVKSITEKGTYEVDEEAAGVVRYIYEMRAKGYGYCSIVKELNEKGIKSPGAYRYEKGIIRDEQKANGLWRRYSVEDMLHDEVYLGNMVRGKTRSAFYKGEKRHHVSREEWIVVKGTHEPIISQELFDKVQEVNREKADLHQRNLKKAKGSVPIDNLFAGKLVCGDCGITMGYARSGRQSMNYFCTNYKENGELGCKKKYISTTELEKAVFEVLKIHIATFLECVDNIQLLNRRESVKSKREQLKKELLDLETGRTEYQQKMGTLYLDYKNKLLTIQEYFCLKEQYGKKLAEYEKLCEEKKEVMSQLDEKYGQDCEFAKVALQFADDEVLTREMIESLIDKIEIYPKKRIHIIFRYEDQFEEVRNFMEKLLEVQVVSE